MRRWPDLGRLSALWTLPQAAATQAASAASGSQVPKVGTSRPVATQLARTLAVAGLWVVLACTMVYAAEGAVVALGPRPAGLPGYTDFDIYYSAAQAIGTQPAIDPYNPAALQRLADMSDGCHEQISQVPYLYPPLLAVTLRPLTALSCDDALKVWRAFCIVCWVGAALILGDLVRLRWGGRPGLALWTVQVGVVVACMLAQPVALALHLGQLTLPLLGGVAFVLWLETRGYAASAGALLMLLIALKPQAILLLPYYAARGRWRLLGGAAVATVPLLYLMTAGTGLELTLRSIPVMVFASGVMRQMSSDFGLARYLGTALSGAVALIVGAVFVVAVWRTRRAHADQTLGAAWALCTFLVVSPVLWLHYLALLLPALAAVASSAGRCGWTVAMSGVLAVLLVVPTPALPFLPLATWALTGIIYCFISSAPPPQGGIRVRMQATMMAVDPESGGSVGAGCRNGEPPSHVV